MLGLNVTQVRISQMNAALLLATHAMALDDSYRHPQMHTSYLRRLVQTGGQILIELYPDYQERGLILLLNTLAVQNRLMANWREYVGEPQLIPDFSIFGNGRTLLF